ncbi:MAG TPA: hypothetical protein VGD78_17740 [Chthoniobacterales bacterium]
MTQPTRPASHADPLLGAIDVHVHLPANGRGSSAGWSRRRWIMRPFRRNALCRSRFSGNLAVMQTTGLAGSLPSVDARTAGTNLRTLKSLCSLGSRESIGSIGSRASIGSIGSIASIGSIGSIASIGSIGSIASIGSIGSIASIGSTGARRAIAEKGLSAISLPVLAPSRIPWLLVVAVLAAGTVAVTRWRQNATSEAKGSRNAINQRVPRIRGGLSGA